MRESFLRGKNNTGTVALVGAGEYLPAMEPVDRALLAYLDAPARVVVLPTASAPDGPGVPEKWMQMGVEHFTRLGARVQPIRLLTREHAEDAALAGQIAHANFVYLSGGKPRYLLETLQGTRAWQAILQVYDAGGVVAGCSAGAMVLGGEVVDFPQVWRTLPALGLVSGIVVIPHFDELPSGMSALIGKIQGTTLVGIDGMTALVAHRGRYTVSGRGHVTVMAQGSTTRYHNDQQVALPGGPPRREPEE